MEQLGTYSNVGTLVMLVALVVYKFLKHSSCKSRCLGQENSIKIDLSASENKLDETFKISPPSPRHSPRPRIYV